MMTVEAETLVRFRSRLLPRSSVKKSTRTHEPSIIASPSMKHVITQSSIRQEIRLTVNFPYLGTQNPITSESVAAADPLIIDERDIEGFAVIYEAWIKRRHIYRWLRVKDNSMYSIVSNGSIVVIDLKENDPLKLDRQIVAARHKDGVTIK